jgi:6-phosphogluconolactonase (cycloisomerase 2 family)
MILIKPIMETNYSEQENDYADAIEFSKTASKRHLNFNDLHELAYIINESEYSNKMRKINRNRKKLKIKNTSQNLENSAE